MPHTEGTFFTGDLGTSSFVKNIIETYSGKISENLNEILTSLEKDSSQLILSQP